MANHKQRKAMKKRETSNLIGNIEELVPQIGEWDPSKPNWKLMKEPNDFVLLEIADMYKITFEPHNKRFLEILLQSGPMTSKQRFRLLCVLQHAIKITSGGKSK